MKLFMRSCGKMLVARYRIVVTRRAKSRNKPRARSAPQKPKRKRTSLAEPSLLLRVLQRLSLSRTSMRAIGLLRPYHAKTVLQLLLVRPTGPSLACVELRQQKTEWERFASC